MANQACANDIMDGIAGKGKKKNSCVGTKLQRGKNKPSRARKRIRHKGISYKCPLFGLLGLAAGE